MKCRAVSVITSIANNSVQSFFLISFQKVWLTSEAEAGLELIRNFLESTVTKRTEIHEAPLNGATF